MISTSPNNSISILLQSSNLPKQVWEIGGAHSRTFLHIANDLPVPDDVSRVIAVMPREASRTLMLASLFLFAMSTGCRGDSCSHVRLCDFLCCRENPDGCLLVGVRIVKLKSRPTESLELTIAGNPNVESTVDVVYWLNEYLQGWPLFF